MIHYEFYVDICGDGYVWRCQDCEQELRHIEVGDYLGSHMTDAELHECTEQN